ncbi:hypothetical protein CAEBREN_13011 [Caenorhabditis brenneri]|uniref:SPK domain-containing protein n=1 Tax=Caenorhabditis brenneri TaxID=135651 RepID=G0M7K1_CAEBE|nr:hypothetical protein CAEBREN_13011 [Caenorhabditis brenneri]
MSAAWGMLLKASADEEDLERSHSYVSCHINLGNGLCKEIRFTTNCKQNIVTIYIKDLARSTAMDLARNMIRARVDLLKKIIDGYRLTIGRFSYTFAINVINEFLSDNMSIQEFELQNFAGVASWAELKSTEGISWLDEEGRVITKTRKESMEDNVYPVRYDWLYSNKLFDLDPITEEEAFYRVRTQWVLFGRRIPMPEEWNFDQFLETVRAKQSHKKPIQEHTPSTKRLICSFMGECTSGKYREFRVRYTTEMMNFEIPDLQALTVNVRFRCRLRRDVSKFKIMWDAVGKSVNLNSAPYLHAMFEAGEEAIEEFEKENMTEKSTSWADELPLEHFLRFFTRTIHYETSQEAMKVIEDDPIATQSGIDFLEKFKLSGDRRSAFNEVVFDTVPLTEADLYPSPPANGNHSGQTENGACSEQNTSGIEQKNVTINETRPVVDEAISTETTASSSLSSRVATPQLDEELTNGDVSDPKRIDTQEPKPVNLQSPTPTLSYAKVVKKSKSNIPAAQNPVQKVAISAKDAVPSVPVVVAKEAVLERQEYQQKTSNINKSRRGKNYKKNDDKQGDRQVGTKQNGVSHTNTPTVNGNNANGVTHSTSDQTKKSSQPPEASIPQPLQQQVTNGKQNQNDSIQRPNDSNNSSNTKTVAANQNGLVSPPNQKKQKKAKTDVSKKDETIAAGSNSENEARISSANQNGQAGMSNGKQKKEVKCKAMAQEKEVQNQNLDESQVQAPPPAQRDEVQALVPADDANGPRLNDGAHNVDVAHAAPNQLPNDVASTSNRKQKKEVKSNTSARKKKVQDRKPDKKQAVQAQNPAQREEVEALAPAEDGNSLQLNNGEFGVAVAHVGPEPIPNDVAPNPDADNGVPEQRAAFIAQDQANVDVPIAPNVVNFVPGEEAVPVAPPLNAINNAPEQEIVADALQQQKEGNDQPGTSEKPLSKSQKRKARKAAIKALEKKKEASTFDVASTDMLHKLILSSADNWSVEADIALQVKSAKHITQNKNRNKTPETIVIKADFTDGSDAVILNGVELADHDTVQHPELPISSSGSDNEKESSAGDGSKKICTYDYRPGVRNSQDDDAPEQEGTEMQLMNSKGCSAGNDYDDDYETVPSDPTPRTSSIELPIQKNKVPYVASEITHHNMFQILLHLSSNRRLICSIEHERLIYQRLQKFRNLYFFRRRVARAMLHILQEDLPSEKERQRETAILDKILLYMFDFDSIHRGLRFLDRRLNDLGPTSTNYYTYARIREKLLGLIHQGQTIYDIVKNKANFSGYEGHIEQKKETLRIYH